MGKTVVGSRNCREAGQAETDETADDDALPLAAVCLLGKELGGLPDQHEESDEWVENELEGLHEAAFTCGVHSFSKGFYENRVVLFARDSEKLKTKHRQNALAVRNKAVTTHMLGAVATVIQKRVCGAKSLVAV